MMTYLSYESSVIYMSDIDTEREKSFRERYAGGPEQLLYKYA
jgi:hypothetical protein